MTTKWDEVSGILDGILEQKEGCYIKINVSSISVTIVKNVPV